jgi:hypothetical protein
MPYTPRRDASGVRRLGSRAREGNVVAGRKRSSKPVNDATIGAECDRYLAALAGHHALWATSTQLGFPTKEISAAVVKRLIAQQRILGVGKVKRADAYTLLGSETAKARLISLAEQVVTEQLMLEAERTSEGSVRLVLLPLSAGAKRYASIPKKVRDHIVPALQQCVLRSEAFPVRIGGSHFVALAANLSRLLGVSASPQQPLVQPAAPALDRTSVVRAYEQLSLQRRSPNIIVSELQRESGVELRALQGWLLAECRARRAVPLLGEPAHATPEQLAAALVVEGRPHLYVRLVQEQQS